MTIVAAHPKPLDPVRSRQAGAKPAPALAGKSLILGIGAQKAGTSWLYEFLRAHPLVYMPGIKELH
jgi:hypothetical protein